MKGKIRGIGFFLFFVYILYYIDIFEDFEVRFVRKDGF